MVMTLEQRNSHLRGRHHTIPIIHHEYATHAQTVNKEFYQQIILQTCLCITFGFFPSSKYNSKIRDLKMQKTLRLIQQNNKPKLPSKGVFRSGNTTGKNMLTQEEITIQLNK